jgi:hypothetical protein
MMAKIIREIKKRNRTCDAAARALLVHDDLFQFRQLLSLNDEAVRAIVGFANQGL